jgi:hypothetical protein
MSTDEMRKRLAERVEHCMDKDDEMASLAYVLVHEDFLEDDHVHNQRVMDMIFEMIHPCWEVLEYLSDKLTDVAYEWDSPFEPNSPFIQKVLEQIRSEIKLQQLREQTQIRAPIQQSNIYSHLCQDTVKFGSGRDTANLIMSFLFDTKKTEPLPIVWKEKEQKKEEL